MARQSISTSGFRELEAKLAELPKNIGRGVARRAVRRAADQVAEEQRRLAPKADGDLIESVRVQLRARNTTGLAEYAGVREAGGTAKEAASAMRAARRVAREEGYQQGVSVTATIGPSAPHAHLVEFGTGPRQQKNGKSTGVMPAQPFMRPAFDNNVDRAIETMKDGLAEEIDKANARIARKAARGG